ncbi:COG4280 domain-containing protein [Paenibacillus aestuarii]|uniref:COG4280 domain-containing protein n=1 Tax=Paenibacillus aestuarii TaxID=516965 RepID=A0ABW0KJ80_9BACL|nr:FTR1 family protein [Paenibacillus aestuarii]
MNSYVIIASFLGTTVEFVEALTIVLAVGVVRGWKSSLSGMVVAVALLVALVALFGLPLMQVVRLEAFQLVIGILMLLFGMRWLRKAILRYSGLKALHLEDKAYQEELERQSSSNVSAGQMDWFGFATSFNIVLLEGIEAVFIVITFGLAANSLSSAIAGSLIGLLVVVIAGVLLRKPLAMIPENTMKFIVGLMLSGFGIFWVGEGIGVNWWHADVSILVITLVLLVISFLSVNFLSRKHKGKHISKKAIGERA